MIKNFTYNEINVGEYWVNFNLKYNDPKIESYFINENRLSFDDFKIINNYFKNKETTILIYIEIYPSFRKKGFGQKLLDKIKKESNDQIILISEKVDDFLLDFYKKNGFKEIKTNNHLPILILQK